MKGGMKKKLFTAENKGVAKYFCILYETKIMNINENREEVKI